MTIAQISKPLPSFHSIPEDLLLSILFRLFEDPRDLARLACVCSRFHDVITNICYKVRCEQTLPLLVPALLSPSSEPPGGWASLQKLAVCCPGLWHAGVLLEKWDSGSDGGHALFGKEDQEKEENGGGGGGGGCDDDSDGSIAEGSRRTYHVHKKTHREEGRITTGSDSQDVYLAEDPRSETHKERGEEEEKERTHNFPCSGFLEHPSCGSQEKLSHDLLLTMGRACDDALIPSQIHASLEKEQVRNIDDKAPNLQLNSVMIPSRDAHGELLNCKAPCQLDFVVIPIRSAHELQLSEMKSGWKSNKKRSFEHCHMALGCGSLSREQGNKLLANRFRSDSLYICDWPGCIHPGERRKYKVFRGIFKNFKNSHVWRNLTDMRAKATKVGCAFCECDSTWDMVSTFCLKRCIEFHDDGEPVVRAYVCENGHVAGAWTDRPMYNL